MPRTYIRKKIKTYTPQDLAEAIEKVKNGQLTQYSAAQQYKIPSTTLYEHVKKCKDKETTRPNAGRPTVIPLEDEKILANAIKTMEKWGFGLSRFEIMDIVAEYVRVNKIQTPFKDNIPGPDWFINFRKRHRLSIKKAQSVEFVRRKMTDPFVIAEYFDLLKNTLKDLNLFESPEFIWNLDETSVCLDPSKTKVVGQINKPCARTTHGSGKENITVLTGASAGGKKLPPLIVFKGKFVWDQWMADLGDDYDFELSYAASTNGWMETDIFYNYMEKVLIPHLGNERPVLIIYDGHSTHVDAKVVNLAIQNDVTILKLPPHTSHLLQPLDIAVFKSFKVKWDAKLVEWQRRNIGTKMPKKVFAQALAETWQQTSPDVIKSGFKKGGIYPFNAQVIPVDKYDPDAYKRYEKKISQEHFDHTQQNHKNPKSLKAICIDSFNNQQLLVTNDAVKKSNTGVILLSQVPKFDTQRLAFVAKQVTQIPTCLQNFKPIQGQTQQHPKVNIISNVVIKEASQTPLSAQPPSQPSCTFEELLLRKVQQDTKNNITLKKKRVTKGAEVITASMGKKILEETEKTKNTKAMEKNNSNKKDKKKRIIKKDNSTCSIQEDQPGPSEIKNKKKRKRQPSLDSITSVSDILSVYSDIDIIDGIDLEELVDEQSEDDLEVDQDELRSQKNTRNVKCSGKKVLTNKDSNSLSTKGKGVGKKSQGKENQVNKKDKEKEDDDEDYVHEKNMTTRNDSKKKLKDEQQQLFEHKKNVNETQEEEIYKPNDSVLVRYLIRKKWRYYIGFIEEITEYEDAPYFAINFLKAMKQHQQLTFTTTKKKDSDKVPESLIVKKIFIQENSDNKKEFYLCNDEDKVYFD